MKKNIRLRFIFSAIFFGFIALTACSPSRGGDKSVQISASNSSKPSAPNVVSNIGKGSLSLANGSILVTGLGANQATISWKDAVTNRGTTKAPQIDNLHIDYYIAVSLTSNLNTMASIKTLAKKVLSAPEKTYTVSDLKQNTTYYVNILAWDSSITDITKNRVMYKQTSFKTGEDFSNLAFSKPLIVSSYGDKKLSLAWGTVATSSPVTYKLYYSEAEFSMKDLLEGKSAFTPATDPAKGVVLLPLPKNLNFGTYTNLNNGKVYYFQIVATINSKGYIYSDVVHSEPKDGKTLDDCIDIKNSNDVPLGVYQWSLYNTGNLYEFDYFADSLGKDPLPGIDINIKDVLLKQEELEFTDKKQCLSGKGVKVNIVDSGIDFEKSPFFNKNNYVLSIDVSSGIRDNFNPIPLISKTMPISQSAHGTAVAGIIAMNPSASGWPVEQQIPRGGIGIARNVTLSASNIMTQIPDKSSQRDVNGYWKAALSGCDSCIFNLSIGSDYFSSGAEINDPSYGAELLKTIQDLSSEKSVYVKAASNNFNKLYNEDIDGNLTKRTDIGNICGSIDDIAFNSCQDSNMDLMNTLNEVIVVGAVNARGVKTSYSTTGSNLWISAIGGEQNGDPIYLAQMNNTLYNLGPAILTTTIPGCENKSPYNKFNMGKDLSVPNSDCNFTNIFNGTSAATPMVSGAIALMREKKPRLTSRQIKYILAATADYGKIQWAEAQNGVKKTVWTVDNPSSVQSTIYSKNAASSNLTNPTFNFSREYGFGLLNVKAALEFMDNSTLRLGKDVVELPWITAGLTTTATPPKLTNSIINYPDSGAKCAVFPLFPKNLNISDEPKMSFIEGVKVYLDVVGDVSHAVIKLLPSLTNDSIQLMSSPDPYLLWYENQGMVDCKKKIIEIKNINSLDKNTCSGLGMDSKLPDFYSAYNDALIQLPYTASETVSSTLYPMTNGMVLQTNAFYGRNLNDLRGMSLSICNVNFGSGSSAASATGGKASISHPGVKVALQSNEVQLLAEQTLEGPSIQSLATSSATTTSTTETPTGVSAANALTLVNWAVQFSGSALDGDASLRTAPSEFSPKPSPEPSSESQATSGATE